VNRWWLAFMSALVLWTQHAKAATVALVQPGKPAPAVTEALFRLQGELLAIGFEIATVDAPSDPGARARDSQTWLEQMETERHFDAVIEVIGDPNPTAAEIWIYAEPSHRFELSRVVLEPNTRNAAATLAIRTIEVLRSSFVELDLAAKKPPPRRRNPPPLAAPKDPPPVRIEQFGFEAGAAVLVGLNGVGPSVLPLARFNWAPNSSLVVQATLSGLGTQPTIEGAVGSARLAQTQGILSLCYCSPSPAKLRPFLALGAGFLWTALDGQAESPARGHHVSQWSLLVEGSIGARLRWGDRYYMALASRVQLAEPYVAIHFGDRLVATSGRPNLLLTLTVGAWL
jgi:hypothetical protein